MRQHTSLFPVMAVVALAFVMAVGIFISPEFAIAAQANRSATTGDRAGAKPSAPPTGSQTTSDKNEPSPRCGCPASTEQTQTQPRANFVELPPSRPATLDETDEVAALESVQFALSEVGDGASYIWHRNNGRLSGLVQPVTSFKDDHGQICRHVVVILTAGINTKKTEGVACRLTSGQWKLEG